MPVQAGGADQVMLHSNRSHISNAAAALAWHDLERCEVAVSVDLTAAFCTLQYS